MFSSLSTIQQAAALPLQRDDQAEIRVLLITSRRDGRWMLPKGWIEDGETPAQGAAREAYEEAGVRGTPGEVPVGTYRYRKHLPAGYDVRSQVSVYPLLVDEELSDWPEAGQRKRRWISLESARKKVGDRGLARMLKRLCGRDADSLRRTVDMLENNTSRDLRRK